MNNFLGIIIGGLLGGAGSAPPPPTFPCTITSEQTFIVTSNTETACDPILILS